MKTEKGGHMMWTEVGELGEMIRRGDMTWEDLALDDIDIRLKWAGLFHRRKRAPGTFMMRLKVRWSVLPDVLLLLAFVCLQRASLQGSRRAPGTSRAACKVFIDMCVGPAGHSMTCILFLVGLRGPCTPSMRVRRAQVPNGELTAKQLRFLAGCIEPYAEKGCADITTRANLQLRGLTLGEADQIMEVRRLRGRMHICMCAEWIEIASRTATLSCSAVLGLLSRHASVLWARWVA